MVVIHLLGCSSKPADPNQTEERLLKIGRAYGDAANRLGRAPSGFEEIKPELGADASEELLRSPGDKEPFVIIWGVDYNKLPFTPAEPYTVCAYEKTGVKGKRYVLRFPMGVLQMTDEQLRKSQFPNGHKPPV